MLDRKEMIKMIKQYTKNQTERSIIQYIFILEKMRSLEKIDIQLDAVLKLKKKLYYVKLKLKLK